MVHSWLNIQACKQAEDTDLNINRSIRRLTNIFLVLFVALSAGLVYWQVVVAQNVAANRFLNSNRQCTSDAAPVRGKIRDRNGVLLADWVKADPNTPGLCGGYKRVYTDAAQGLEGLIGYYINPFLTETGIEAQFDDFLSGRNGITGLDNNVNHILHVPPHGDDIYLTIDSRIEKILLKNFSTEASIDNNTVFKTDRGSVIVSDPSTGEILGIVSQPGYDPNCIVSCTVDLLQKDMQAKGYDQTLNCTSPCTLDQFKAALQTESVPQDQNLGRACANDSDSCNLIYLNYLNSDPEQPLLFRPTQVCYPPGSTYKTMTLMATLDSGALSLNDPVFYDDYKDHPFPEHLQAIGPITVGSGQQVETLGGRDQAHDISHIQGYTFHFPVSLAYGFSHSDNIIFAEAGVKTGADTWLKYNRAFYVDQKIPFDLPVKVSTVTPQKQENLCSDNPQTETPLTVPALAEGAFGQGKDFVTPFQMMLINNVAADDGKLMSPTILQKIVDPTNQAILQAFSANLLSQPVSTATAQGVRDAMYGVNECGSGSLARVQLSYGYTRWSVIGKTGTAEVPGETATRGGDSWFITQAPYVYQSDTIPRITITAMKENGGEGAYANGPMLRDDYEQIFSQVLTDVQVPAAPPGGVNFCYQSGFLQAK
jgi:penicillin-binding protein A